jgi:uncharacterized protein YndB with AHSA1/START domain
MNPADETARSQSESISFEFDLHHPPERVWRALTDPVLLAEWLLPVVDLELEPGAAFTLTPTASGTRLSLVQSGFEPDQKKELGGARYGWKMMDEKLVALLARIP